MFLGAAGSWRTRWVGEGAGMRTLLLFLGRGWAATLVAGRADDIARIHGEAIGGMFTGDAEIDDPLIAGEVRGGRLDLAGEGMVDDRKVARLLVARNGGVPFFLLLDLETFFIVQRIDPRRQASGREAEVVSRFDRFRPVNGVLLPHSVEDSLDRRQVQSTLIEAMEANPKVDYGIFRRPESAEEKKDRDEKSRSKGLRGFFRKES